uniref:Uncharacterized protein n=1 Tax=Ciona savignyi TaxID=51511 RepID=H2Z2U4_CIOSA
MASVVCCDPMESTSPRFTVHQDNRASMGDLSGLGGSSPTLQPLSCLHCDFQCSLHTEMTQHRWEIHPLLMRRKQHLMTSLIRQRQQSETLSDVTVDSDVGESTSDQEQTSIAPTATSLEKMQKTRSLDDISTLRHELRSDVERTSSQTA